MISHRFTTKLSALIMSAAVCLCLLACVFSAVLADAAGNSGVSMEYEKMLFSGETIDINIIIDEDQWNDMLANAISETYYQCDVNINGKTFYSVGIRPKGNTSLTSIANNPDTDRYSFKLEFDQYLDGQTCYGLDKLILNNNYADATNMKEALVYDMYAYLDADASLYNYAKVSVNGEYWGVYLALEAVEDSFMLRNYGTSNGQLYKPEGLDMGGGGNAGNRDMENFDFGNFGIDNTSLSSPPDFSDFLQQGDFNTAQQLPDMNFSNEIPHSKDGEVSRETIGERLEPPNTDIQDNMQQFSFGFSSSGGADLNYAGDELDSYSTIWEGSITRSSDSDHKRVVTALKNIASGTELENYMDVDNLLRYMAVHTFCVNNDSLSGNMAHNYYLYEYGGKLNILPWDYNLAFGGMQGANASDTINYPINSPFSGTDFFDTLLENDDYREQYHEYLKLLSEEYTLGGGFEEFYNNTRARIDSLVADDPTAFYTYNEYEAAAQMLCKTLSLRAASVIGQIDGSVPSTSSEQRSNSTALIDSSDISISVMGTMNIGGGENEFRFDFQKNDSSPNTDKNPDSAPMFNGASAPFASSSNKTVSKTLIIYILCFVLIIAAIIFAKLFKRHSYKR